MGPSVESISFHQLTPPRWGAPSRGRGLVLSQLHVLGIESSGIQWPRGGWGINGQSDFREIPLHRYRGPPPP